MFSPKKYVLFIEKSKLSLYIVALNHKLNNKKLLESEWSLQNFPDLILKIKKKIKKPLRVLLSDDFVYLEAVAIKSEVQNQREEVKIKAQELIPDSLDKTIWDFKDVLLINGPSSKEKVVQVMVLTQIFYEKIYLIMQKIGLAIEAIEPVSYSLARFLKNITDPAIIINLSSPNNLIMVKNGLVLASEQTEKEITFKDLTVFIDYVKKRFSIAPKIIYFCGNTQNLNLKNFETLGLKAGIHQFDPVVSLALKIDIKGVDQKVLNLSSFNANNPKDNNEQKIILFLILLTLFFLGSLGFLFFSKTGLDNLLKSLYAIFR